MTENSSLSFFILKSVGLFSDAAIDRIILKRAENPGMKLVEAAVKFGGVKEPEFLEAVGKSLSIPFVDLEKSQPTPDALQSFCLRFVFVCEQAYDTSLL